MFPGDITIAINAGQAVQIGKIKFLDALDFVGVEGYFRLDAAADSSAASLRAAWAPIVEQLRELHVATGKDIMFTEVGYQSRANSYVFPASTNASVPEDDSCTSLGVDTDEQANAYEALLSSLYAERWFLGVNWWLWRADPTAGGDIDDSFTPQGKPATLRVLRDWYEWYK